VRRVGGVRNQSRNIPRECNHASACLVPLPLSVSYVKPTRGRPLFN
jgi:hypothetical protein